MRKLRREGDEETIGSVPVVVAEVAVAVAAVVEAVIPILRIVNIWISQPN